MKHMPLFDGRTVTVLTVRQPWAYLIVQGHKTIENRTWRTSHRGPLYIHAGSKLHATPIVRIERHFGLSIDRAALTFGAIVGRVDLVDIVEISNSPWFEGPYGWMLERAEAFTGASMPGRLGLFQIPEKTLR